MKLQHIAFVLLALGFVACAADPPRRTGSETTNSQVNDGEVNDSEVNSSEINDAATGGNTRTVNCESRADCSGDQECRAGACQDHLKCDQALYSDEGGGGCFAGWVDCADGKSYLLKCNDNDSCKCIVDNETVHEFGSGAACLAPGGKDLNRLVNTTCTWLVPAL